MTMSPAKSSPPSPLCETKKQPANPLEIRAKDLKASGFSRQGSGYKRGPPGGVIYEKASSRHKRHREVFRSSEGGQAVVEKAVPLGTHQPRSPGSFDRIVRRKALMEAAKKYSAEQGKNGGEMMGAVHGKKRATMTDESKPLQVRNKVHGTKGSATPWTT